MLFRVLSAIAILACATSAMDVRLRGRVIDETGKPVSGALIRISDSPRVQAVSDPQGAFTLTAPEAESYRVDVERDGYFRLPGQTIDPAAGELTLTLNTMREVFESIDVPAQLAGINPDTTAREKRLTENQIVSIPYPSTNNLKNAMRVIPGVVQDQRGGVHIEGGAEDQALYTLDGFNIADPVTGRFESRLTVESVRAVEVSAARLSAEYGKGSAGAVAVKSLTGDDKFRYFGTNFIPGFENRKGYQIGNWTPRFGATGPLLRGRAWFSNAFDTQYDRHVVEELPKGEDRSTSWRWSNLARVQVNLTPSHILHAGFLANRGTADYVGLGLLDPRETTLDRRSRQNFWHIKEQSYFAGGLLLEVGYAANRTWARDLPQGQGILLLTPEGKRGFNFLNASRWASRDQGLVNAFLPTVRLAGEHRVKIGADINGVGYTQDAFRSGYDQYRETGALIRQVRFAGSGDFRRHNTEIASYLQDSWRVRPSVLLELGVRHDRDSLVRRNYFSPRAALAWSPRQSPDMRISAGFGVIYDASNLRLFTRPLDQFAITTWFAPLEGVSAGRPAASLYFRDPDAHLGGPRYTQWSAGWEQRFGGSLLLRADWLRRRGRRGFTYENQGPGADAFHPLPPECGALDAFYLLGNGRRDRYDSLAFTVRKTFSGQYEWMASYTRSRASSNAVVDFNIDDPLLVGNLLGANAGPLPWDAPHRFVSWGYLPSPWKNWAVAYLVEARNGFPFSVQDEGGRVVGSLNSKRYPYYFEGNLHLERKIAFAGFRWAFRLGANNLTGRRNPTTVNANLASARFLSFYGGQGRTFNFRIRWLGRNR